MKILFLTLISDCLQHDAFCPHKITKEKKEKNNNNEQTEKINIAPEKRQKSKSMAKKRNGRRRHLKIKSVKIENKN